MITIPLRRNGERILASWFNILATAFNTVQRNIIAIDENYAIASGYNTIMVDATTGEIDITLPDVTLSIGVEIVIIAIFASDANKINIIPQSGTVPIPYLRMSNEAIRLITNGVNWYVSA